MPASVLDAVAVAQVSVVGAAAPRHVLVHRPAVRAVERSAGAEEHAAADVDAAVGSERVAHHVDGFEVEAFAVPFLVHVESEPVFEVTNDAAGGDLQISFGGADEQQVVHVPQLVRDEPAAGDVSARSLAFEVVVDRPADEHGRGAAGVLAMGFQSVSYLDYAGVRRCWMGSGLLAGCSV